MRRNTTLGIIPATLSLKMMRAGDAASSSATGWPVPVITPAGTIQNQLMRLFGLEEQPELGFTYHRNPSPTRVLNWTSQPDIFSTSWVSSPRSLS